jgi:predicted RNA-binding protein YlxR (DUF448 family)
MASPERQCVGCRTRRPQGELVRLARVDDRVVPWHRGMAGRSAYLCPEVQCLEAAERRHAFARALRGPVTTDPAVRDDVERRATGVGR